MPTPCWARMHGHYPGNRGVRPLGVCGSERRDAPPARLFLCADCRAQAVICSCCDRGQVYCAGDCAQRARRRKQDAAGRRYQTSRRGRLAHAERARRYQSKSTLVTTNRPFAEWREVFPNAACVVSLVDRLVHNAEIIAIEGDS
jgi:hypothetical protein